MNRRIYMEDQLRMFAHNDLKAYIVREEMPTFDPFGIVSDGANVVLIEYSDYGSGLTMTYKYPGTRAFGNGVLTTEREGKTELTLNDFNASVSEGIAYTNRNGIRRYRSLEQFFRHERNRGFYVPVE